MKKRLLTSLVLIGVMASFSGVALAHTPYVNMHRPYTEDGNKQREQQNLKKLNEKYGSLNPPQNHGPNYSPNHGVVFGTRVIYTHKEVGTGPIEQVVEPAPPQPNYYYYGVPCYGGGCW